jgi:hypothetical protein
MVDLYCFEIEYQRILITENVSNSSLFQNYVMVLHTMIFRIPNRAIIVSTNISDRLIYSKVIPTIRYPIADVKSMD